MFTTTTTTLLLSALASLGSASPIKSARQWPTPYPPYTTAKFFTLVANISDPARAASVFVDVPPPTTGWVLTGVHAGAGQNAAILSPPPPSPSESGSKGGPILFQNGTARDISARATSIMLPPFSNGGGGFVPTGIQIMGTGKEEGSGVVHVGMNFGPGTVGVGIEAGLRSPYAQAFNPVSGGRWLVCYEENPTYMRFQYLVKVVADDAERPQNCVEMRLLSQCVKEEDEPEGGLKGVEELKLVNEGVGCYESVEGIEWGLY